MKKFLPEIALFMLVIFLNMLAGCSYYKVKRIQPVTNDNVVQMPLHKYIVIHHGNQAWHLANISMDNDKKELTGTLEELSYDHQKYLTPKVPGANRFKYSQGKPELEVHMYIEEYSKSESNRIVIPVTSISKIDLYEPDKGATTASWVFGTIGVALGAFVILMVIILLTKSSCPLVYINDGIAFRFAGETYGGAVNACSERDDYMPLHPIAQVNGYYDIKISNELLERQYTDLAELVVVDLPANSTALIDRLGNVQLLSSLRGPERAEAPGNQSCTQALTSRDSLSFLFNQSNTNNPELSSLVLNFVKPANAKDAKLVLHAKNSYWLDYIFGKFNENFGTFFNEFSERQKKVPPQENLQWSLNQGIPLSVFVETSQGWKFVDYVPTIGPLAARDVVVPVDLSGVTCKELNIKLECGFMFWELDYAAADFSSNSSMTIHKVPASVAMDEKGMDISQSLSKVDKKYLFQPNIGNEAKLKFKPVTTSTSSNQLIFLHTRGYYEYIRNYTGKPDLAYLKSFREKGAFARFSKVHYDSYADDPNLLVNALAGNAK